MNVGRSAGGSKKKKTTKTEEEESLRGELLALTSGTAITACSEKGRSKKSQRRRIRSPA